MSTDRENLDKIRVALDTEGDAKQIAREGVNLVAKVLTNHADCGGAAWKRPALAPHLDYSEAILVRMSDAFAHLRTLLRSDITPKVKNQSVQMRHASIEDTMAVIAGLALLYNARPAIRVSEAGTPPSDVAGPSRRKCANCGRQGDAIYAADGLCPCTDYANWISKTPTDN